MNTLTPTTVALTLLVLGCTGATDDTDTTDTTDTTGTSGTTADTASGSGSVQISVATSGTQLDPDGYVVSIDGQDAALDVDGMVVVADLEAGDYDVTLSEEALNCQVSGDNPATVTVVSDQVAKVAFAVVCAPALFDKVVWSSYRADDYGLYVVDPDGKGETVLTDEPGLDVHPDVSPDGTKVAFVSDRDGTRDIYVVNADGSGVVRLTKDGANESGPKWSPDGARIAFASEVKGNRDIYAMNADGSGVTRLTDDPASDNWPTWSPDGTQLAFQSERGTSRNIYLVDDAGTKVQALTTEKTASIEYPRWSWATDRIAYSSNAVPGNWDVYTMMSDGTDMQRVTKDASNDSLADWSPDGTQLVFRSDRDGDFELYVSDVDGSNVLPALTTDPGFDTMPTWGPASGGAK